MTRIAVLTPDPADPSYAGQWPGVLERLSDALKAADVTVEPTPWTDHIGDASALTGYPLVLPLIVWGYHRDHDRWMQACATWAAAGVRMLNPADVIAWNSDKSYLGRLADKGVAVPDTMWVEGVDQADVDAAFDRFGVDTVVVKPRVSGGAWKTLRLSRGETMVDAPQGPAMIQPYLPSIETEGETSLLFFGGALSHVVNKRPVGGDFRIQVQFGGQYVALPEPPAAALALAQQTLAAIDEDLLYARIDMAQAPEGGWRLMEAELIEPDFYLGSAPDGGAKFAAAVKVRLEASA
ncbi:ATP-grasp domain-containing protein [Brevundimonas lenta]|uniref:Glutathione synthase/RimK-type ligase-like ATP-grasp enzyme n=1 Tax=Brevundimonas lenta TaxID=424796 RepID=A0A7W6JCE5_9CAUL|nr:transporter [Brevundimonas lenta]MBB4081601.1 glutathione synthase/RimK-type ligase-like ATP-grasp enzyme [Brevundimonas lenta]